MRRHRPSTGGREQHEVRNFENRPAQTTADGRLLQQNRNKAAATFWIDDPAVAGMSGLLARRAWKLSVPILSHVFREAVQDRLQTLTVAVDDGKARIASYAPMRGWYSPLAIAAGVAVLSAIYWLYVHGSVLAALRRSLG